MWIWRVTLILGEASISSGSIKTSAGRYTSKLYQLRLLCRHVQHMVLACQLRISQTLHHDRRKFLQCHPWVFCRGVFHYNTLLWSKMNQYLTEFKNELGPSLQTKELFFSGTCWFFFFKWSITVSTLVMASLEEWSAPHYWLLWTHRSFYSQHHGDSNIRWI